jgi:hypothetical protein
MILKQIFLSFFPSFGERKALSIMDNILPSTDLFSIPDVFSAFEQSMNGTPYPFYVSIIALICTFLYFMLNFAIFGHIIIAMCRMVGFKALRNTYNPLGSRSIAELWNRYFEKKQKLRMFFAIISAAFFGNFVFHYLGDFSRILEVGPLQAFLDLSYYLIYAIVLAVSIAVSQLLTDGKPRTENNFKNKILAPIGVCTFYCLLIILNHSSEVDITFIDRVNFFFSLLNVD